MPTRRISGGRSTAPLVAVCLVLAGCASTRDAEPSPTMCPDGGASAGDDPCSGDARGTLFAFGECSGFPGTGFAPSGQVASTLPAGYRPRPAGTIASAPSSGFASVQVNYYECKGVQHTRGGTADVVGWLEIVAWVDVDPKLHGDDRTDGYLAAAYTTDAGLASTLGEVGFLITRANITRTEGPSETRIVVSGAPGAGLDFRVAAGLSDRAPTMPIRFRYHQSVEGAARWLDVDVQGAGVQRGPSPAHVAAQAGPVAAWANPAPELGLVMVRTITNDFHFVPGAPGA